MRRRDLVHVGEDDKRGHLELSFVHAPVEEGVHVSALVALVLEGGLARRKLTRVEDGVDELGREGGEAVGMLGKGEVLSNAGERAVGLDDEELGDDGVELVQTDVEEVELGGEEDGVPDFGELVLVAGFPAVESA